MINVRVQNDKLFIEFANAKYIIQNPEEIKKLIIDLEAAESQLKENQMRRFHEENIWEFSI